MNNTPSALDPQGAAIFIADLWWLLLGLGTLVFLLVMTYLATALRRGGASPLDPPRPVRGTRAIVLGGVILPVIVLSIVLVATVRTLWALSSLTKADPLVIHVMGQQWWWEVQYPDHQFETANEIHIPVGEPVQIHLSSDNVIHSFWVPELHGKLDLIPGKTNTFWIQADRPGEYRGLCAEYCGVQHANMMFLVIAEPPEQFAAWLEAQRQPAAQPTDELAKQGQEIFLASTCINCHTVAGTNATGDLGPDLTHLAARRTLGSAMIVNNIGNLGGWIADPQHIKPGNLMPPAENLDGAALQALLAYLQTLR